MSTAPNRIVPLGSSLTTITYDSALGNGKSEKQDLKLNHVSPNPPFAISPDIQATVVSLHGDSVDIYGPNLNTLPLQLQQMLPVLRSKFSDKYNISILYADKIALVGRIPKISTFISDSEDGFKLSTEGEYIEFQFPESSIDPVNEEMYSGLFEKMSSGRFLEPENLFTIYPGANIDTFDFENQFVKLRLTPEEEVRQLKRELGLVRREAIVQAAIAASANLQLKSQTSVNKEMAALIGKQRYDTFKSFVSSLENILRLVRGERKEGALSGGIVTAYRNYSVRRDELQKAWGMESEQDFEAELFKYCERYDEQSQIVSMHRTRPAYSKEEAAYNAARETLQQSLNALMDTVDRNLIQKLSSFSVLVDESCVANNNNGKETSIRQARGLCLSPQAYKNLKKGDFFRLVELFCSSSEKIGYMSREEEKGFFDLDSESLEIGKTSIASCLCKSIENVRFTGGFFINFDLAKERLEELAPYFKKTQF